MNPRIAHLVGLLAIVGPQLAVVWQDQKAGLDNKIAMSAVTLLTLLLTDPKKHATAVTLIRAGIAVAALVVSAVLTKGTLGTVGTSVATTAIAVFVRLQALLPAASVHPIQVEDKTIPIRPRDPQAGHGTPTTVMTLLFAGLAMGIVLLLFSGKARAEPRAPQALGCLDAANTYCVVPAAAVGWQYNLKTGDTANAVSLMGLTLQHTFGSLPLGAGIYAGLGASRANQGSYQGCIGLSITSWGMVCGGAQRLAGESVWQGMVTLAGQLSYGGSPSYVQGER